MEIRGSHGNGQCHWLNLPLLYISCSLCHPPQPLHCILSACLSTECLLLIIGWNTSGQAEPCQSAWPFCKIHKGVVVHSFRIRVLPKRCSSFRSPLWCNLKQAGKKVWVAVDEWTSNSGYALLNVVIGTEGWVGMEDMEKVAWRLVYQGKLTEIQNHIVRLFSKDGTFSNGFPPPPSKNNQKQFEMHKTEKFGGFMDTLPSTENHGKSRKITEIFWPPLARNSGKP